MESPVARYKITNTAEKTATEKMACSKQECINEFFASLRDAAIMDPGTWDSVEMFRRPE